MHSAKYPRVDQTWIANKSFNMRLEIVQTLFVLTAFKEFSQVLVQAKPVEVKSLETVENCHSLNSTKECFLEEGRKKKKPGSNGSSQVVIIENDDNDHDDHEIEEYYVVEGGNKRGKRGKGKKGKGKKKKGSKKIYKKMKPFIIGLGGLKLVLMHLFLKKMAITTALTFLLSKVSFILATLVALKQFFHTPTQHRSAEGSKLEVVHIPIKKFHGHYKDKDYDESQFVPVTFPPDRETNTTPFHFDFSYSENNPGSFFSNDEFSNGKFNEDGTFSGISFDDKFINPNEGNYGQVFDESLSPIDGKFSDSITVEYPHNFDGKFSESDIFNPKFPETFDDKFNSNFDTKFNEDFGGKFNENFDAKFNNNFDSGNPIFGEKIKKNVDGKSKHNIKPNSNKNLNENESFGDIYNEHFQSKLSTASDRSDDDEKSFYKNHVHSPFV